MAKNWHSGRPQLLGSELSGSYLANDRSPSFITCGIKEWFDPVFISGASQSRNWDANNSVSLRREKKKIHLQNFKLALSTNEYALYVKHAGWPLGNAPVLFSRSILFIPFVVMHILSRTRGNQFPCNSSQDAHTYWDTKQDLQTTKFHFVLVEDWLWVMDIQYCLLLKAQMEYQKGFIQLNCVFLLRHRERHSL